MNRGTSLNGIFVSLAEHKMTLVATDGRRLALVDEEVDISEANRGEFIIPTKTVHELARLLGEKGDVEIRLTENQAAFTMGDAKAFRQRLFPSWLRATIPITGKSSPAKPRSASPCRARSSLPPLTGPRS